MDFNADAKDLGDIRGMIFDIQRFSIHDGPGIRTNVFFKGCPLSCVWCHNPESVEKGREIAYYPAKCGMCGACALACAESRHRFTDGADRLLTGGADRLLSDGADRLLTDGADRQLTKDARHVYQRDGCGRCGKCADACVYGALSKIGREITAGEALAEVRKDLPFYETSGGGITLSGGEPFYQPGFALALLKLSKAEGLHTCAETCGAVSADILGEAAGYTDIFLYDVKETSPERHRQVTGVSNELILSNLEALDAKGANIVMRCPVIPGLNDYDGHFQKLGALAGRLANVRQIDLEPYHPLGLSKSEAIGKTARHTDAKMPAAEQSEKWAETLRRYTAKPVYIS